MRQTQVAQVDLRKCDLAHRLSIAANLTIDALLAALALENGATLVSFDTDFQRFPRLKVVLPTAP